MGRELVLHLTNVSSIPGTPYDPPSLQGVILVDSECRARSKS